MEISNFSNIDCISHLVCNLKGHLYAAYESNINIYNLKSGKLVSQMFNIHENSITALLYVESWQCMVTGGSDSAGINQKI
jgi:WD40 repeat protein